MTQSTKAGRFPPTICGNLREEERLRLRKTGSIFRADGKEGGRRADLGKGSKVDEGG